MSEYGGAAQLVELEGDHNSARDTAFLASVYSFLAETLAHARPLQVRAPSLQPVCAVSQCVGVCRVCRV